VLGADFHESGDMVFVLHVAIDRTKGIQKIKDFFV